MRQQTTIIIGAGPAGLTAAYELLNKTNIKPVIYEMTEYVGGIARTVEYKGNKIDIGGHRLFSKSDKVNQWWINFLPLQGAPSKDQIILKKKAIISRKAGAPDPEKTDKVMLIRNRVSRILFLRKLFDYPLSIHLSTFIKLGIVRTLKIGISYFRYYMFPIKKENSLEDFFINRFGKELYVTFFKKYTQKVWGTSCRNLPPDWGYQRIKSISIFKIITAALKKIFIKNNSLSNKEIEDSLIEQFMYPKLGVGQLWEEVAEAIKRKGGDIYLKHKVIDISAENDRIVELKVKDESSGNIETKRADFIFSTMPVKDLIQCLGEQVSKEVKQLADALVYRDFITIGLLLKKMKIKNNTKIKTINNTIPDNWIYIQERDVKLGRIQIYNNWSPYMVRDINTVWLGLEYFCSEGDSLWKKSDTEIIKYGIKESVKLGLIEEDDVLDSTVIRSMKTYPAYDGVYRNFCIIRNFTDKFNNLFMIGRNGMHRYNNMDHSMLTAMAAVENIINNIKSKDNIWAINIELKYHEK
ncbi:MAG: NAD(P)/FAD-dependent oxidoreductase [Candidatus Omnitrophota bacterium]|nr:NAD(P)/FAD-dependent oxidoreductase [Candidatus Omnitrophota bacterium]